MRETRSYGSVRGATREGCPYRARTMMVHGRLRDRPADGPSAVHGYFRFARLN
jgi:hypothetical protein